MFETAAIGKRRQTSRIDFPICQREGGVTMMRKLLVLAVLGLVALGNSSVFAATTRWVNKTDLTPTPPGTSCANAGYMTISAAVGAATSGDTIEVCPGIYPELVMVDK